MNLLKISSGDLPSDFRVFLDAKNDVLEDGWAQEPQGPALISEVGIEVVVQFALALFPCLPVAMCILMVLGLTIALAQTAHQLFATALWRVLIQHCPVPQSVHMLSDEICLLSRRVSKSERLIVVLSVMLQRDKMVKKGADICRLVSRHLSSWHDGNIDILIDEFERCVKR